MHNPKHFEETRVEVMHDLIRAHPLAVLVTMSPQGLDANHIPLEIDPDAVPRGVLRGHIARANPLWREVSPGGEALAIFRGPDTYITPSWYPTKRETGKVVPTWNYAVVHAHGTLRFIEDRAWLRALVTRLTDRFESDRAEPWQVTDAPPDYIEQMLGAIVGIEMPITRLAGKWKASQNRVPRDQDAVVEALARETRESAVAMAEMVRQAQRGK
jgi:transcriptional regulator